MKTLLLAIGIVVAFGAMFLLDRYNTKRSDEGQEGEEENSEESENP